MSHKPNTSMLPSIKFPNISYMFAVGQLWLNEDHTEQYCITSVSFSTRTGYEEFKIARNDGLCTKRNRADLLALVEDHGLSLKYGG
jgi:hypothetical protein